MADVVTNLHHFIIRSAENGFSTRVCGSVLAALLVLRFRFEKTRMLVALKQDEQSAGARLTAISAISLQRTRFPKF